MPDPSTAAGAFEELERRHRKVLAVLPAQHHPVCAAGCDHCCAQRVSVTPLEVFALVTHLRGTLSAVELDRLADAVAAAADRVRGSSAEEHRGSMCPVNDRGRCLGYAARPLLCRGANSLDVEACQRPGAPIPSIVALSEAAQTLQEALDDESIRISARAEMLELTCALAVALADPTVETRWRSGEPVFADAAHAWFTDGQLHHWAREP